MGIIKGSIKLPFTKVFKDKLYTVIDQFDVKKHFEEFSRFMIQAYEKGDGYTKEEVSDENLRNAVKSDLRFSVTDQETGQLITAMIAVDSPLCRSEKPLVHAGFTIGNERYRGYGVAEGKSEG